MKDLEILQSFIELVYKRLPRNPTVNQYYDISQNTNHELAHYQRILTHYFTLLNHRNRTQKEGMYITKIEDIEASLHLLSIVVELPKTNLKEAQERYEYLQKGTQGKEVTRREIQQLLGLSKSQVHRLLVEWLAQNRIEQKGDKNKRYRYVFPRIIPEETTLKTLTEETESSKNMFEEVLEDFENIKTWEDFNTRT